LHFSRMSSTRKPLDAPTTTTTKAPCNWGTHASAHQGRRGASAGERSCRVPGNTVHAGRGRPETDGHGPCASIGKSGYRAPFFRLRQACVRTGHGRCAVGIGWPNPAARPGAYQPR
jgi:hypothetical protein